MFNNSSDQMLKGRASNEADIQISNLWEKIYKIGPGFQNMGNTCFFNSVLQCLTYTPPLANYLLSGEHKKVCLRQNKFCAICLLEQHTHQCFGPNKMAVIQPRKIIQNMQHINKRFKLGRQDDSHELLLLLLESLQKSALDFKPKVDPKQEESSPIYKIFAGKLKSQIECPDCKYRSENFETFYDISLECRETVEKSLDLFFKKEYLKGSNKYRCSKCKKLVDATKGYVIQQVPNVMILQIKRFNNQMMKINTHTSFPSDLDISKYVHQTVKKEEIYDLYGVLVHIGGGINFGHYYCYVKNSNNMWYCMNDSSVSQRSFQEISKDKSYLLFYVKRETVIKPRRKSSADLSNMTQAQKEEQILTTPLVNVEKIPVKGDIIEDKTKDQNKKKTLREEYQDSMKTKEYQQHMKKLDDIFSIKKSMGEGEQKGDNLINDKKVSQTEIEIEQQKEFEEERLTEQIQKYEEIPIKMPSISFGYRFPVVSLKRLNKLRYMNDRYYENKTKLESMSTLSSLNSQADIQSSPKQANLDHLIDENDSLNQKPNKKIKSNIKEFSEEVNINNDKSVQLRNEKTFQNNGVISSSFEGLKISDKSKADKSIVIESSNKEILESTRNSGMLLKNLSEKVELKSKEINSKLLRLQDDVIKKQLNSLPLKLDALEELSKEQFTTEWKLQDIRKDQYHYKEKQNVDNDQEKLKTINKNKQPQRINFDKLYIQRKKQQNRVKKVKKIEKNAKN